MSVQNHRDAKWLAGSLVRKDGAAIFYNGNGLSGEEVRFIVAYELGHVLLSKTEIAHMHLSVSPFAAHGDDLRAVYFAVGLLVPEDELRHQVDIVGLSEGALGLKFGVSADVVKHRVTSLHWRWS